MAPFKNEKSFTLIELVIVLGILAVLAVVVIIVLNPAEFLKQARDSNRISDLQTINKSLGIYQSDGQTSFGQSDKVYVSLPSSYSDCSDLGLPSLPSGWSYVCANSDNYRKVNGNGWLPVPFINVSFGSPLDTLPIDPVNSTSTGSYYTYVIGGSWKLTSLFESEKYATNMNKDGGTDPALFEIGSNLNLQNTGRGLVGYWKFDEGSGTTASDSSGNSNTGTLINGPTWTSGKVGNALSFDGSNDYVDAGNDGSLRPTDAITIAMWVKATDSSQPYGLLINEDTYSTKTGYTCFIQYNSIRLDLGDGTNYYRTSYSISGMENEWLYYVGAWDGTNQILYVNGVQRNIRSWSGKISWNANRTLRIGSGISSNFLPGSLDDVRIYNRALSAAEITAIYNATR